MKLCFYILNRWLPGGQFATFVFYSTWLYSLIQKCLTWRHNKKENKVFVHCTIKTPSSSKYHPSPNMKLPSLFEPTPKALRLTEESNRLFGGKEKIQARPLKPCLPYLSFLLSFFLSFSLSFFLSFILSLTQQHRQRWDSTSFDKLKSYSRLKLKNYHCLNNGPRRNVCL
jgi:hypothetical protein